MTKLIVLVLTLATTLVSGGNYGKGGGFKGGVGMYQGFKGQYPVGDYYSAGQGGYGQTYPSWPGNIGGHQHGPNCYGNQQYQGGFNHYAADKFQGSYPTGVKGFDSYPSYPVDAYSTGFGAASYANSGSYLATGSSYPGGAHFVGSYPKGDFAATGPSYLTGSQFAGSYPSGDFVATGSSYPVGTQFAGSYPGGEYSAVGSSYPTGTQFSGSYPNAAVSSSFPVGNIAPGTYPGSYPPISSGSLQPVAGSSADFGSMPFQSSGNVWTSSEILANSPGQFVNADTKFLQQGSKQIYAGR